jgi:hypothetical protein
MVHAHRTWCISAAESAEELARLLTEHTWTLCTAFELGGYIFANDSFSEDGAAEYAVLKRPTQVSDPYLQVESITFSWCDRTQALDHIRHVLSGAGDAADFVRAVEPHLETAAEHRARGCPLCA